MPILVVGGAGYIGSHTVLTLLEAGHEVVVLDSLVNASSESLKRVAKITGKRLSFIKGDVRNRACLDNVFRNYYISSVIHFAGLKAVGESTLQPLEYYENNVYGTLVLCQAMKEAGVTRLIFSSSATVYGDQYPIPLHEELPSGNPTNPYGRTKKVVEEILQDLVTSDSRWSIALLRYFNPVGAHCSGMIGEDPQGLPNNLLPYVAQVAIGRRECLSIYGNDYPTPDGTGIRDYIHVMDLAEGHLCAMQAILDRSGIALWNLGTGHGFSVLEVVRAFEKVSGRKIPYCMKPRRLGDVASCWADPRKAEKELGWQAKRNLDDMMADTWRWQSLNPNGYQSIRKIYNMPSVYAHDIKVLPKPINMHREGA